MKFVMPIVEQLDQAARELQSDHPIHHRLALILVDNATELILHRRCGDAVRWDKSLAGSGTNKLTPKQWRAGLGEHLDDKLALLRFVNDITDQEKRFITICHDYRGELYHVGLNHERILRSMAATYFRLCCRLLARLRPDSISSAGDLLTDVGRKYQAMLENKEPGKLSRFGFVHDFDKLATLLVAECPETTPVAEELSLAAGRAVDEIEDNFVTVRDYMNEMARQPIVDRNNKVVIPASGKIKTDKDVLADLQRGHEFGIALEKLELTGPWILPENRARATALRLEMDTNFRPKHDHLPIEPWRRRALRLAEATDEVQVLIDYQALRDECAYLETVTLEAAMDLDHHIQMEIDIARGK